MPSGVRLLLRLPPAIRHQAQFRETLGLATPCSTKPVSICQFRAFSITSAISKNEKNVFKKAQPNKPAPQGHKPTKASLYPGKFGIAAGPRASNVKALPPTNAPHQPPKPYPRPQSRPQHHDWISLQFPNSERVLLYVAPNHGIFFAFAHFFGIMLIIGAFTYSQTFLNPGEGISNPPWSLKIFAAVPTVFTVFLGVICLLAPMKIIKSVALVKEAGAATVSQTSTLRIEVKTLVPFAKPKILESTPKKVFLNRNVRMSAQDLRFTNYSIEHHEWFTERYFSGKPMMSREGNTVNSKRSLMAAWLSLRKNVRRICLRDQMAYLQVKGYGNFKLDLQDSHLLDGGRVLEQVTHQDPGARPSVAAWINNLLG